MLKGSLRNFIRELGFLYNVHKPASKPNVFIFSMPRSGSTWLQELIWSQPEFKYVNEPLNLKGSWLQRKSEIQGFEELYSAEVKEKLIAYFNGFVEGKHHFLNPNPLRKTSRFLTSRIVFKVIHGGELFLNDIAAATNCRIVYLIRNPVAVALSRKQLPRVEQLTSDIVLSKFSPSEQNLALEIFKRGDSMEKRIMAWCIQNKLALMSRKDDWLVFSYEELTLRPEVVVQALAAHCELPNPELMLKSVNVPSAVTSQSQKGDIDLMKGGKDERLDLIRKWRERVSAEDLERYFDICRQMNFEVYKEDEDLPNSSFLVENPV